MSMRGHGQPISPSVLAPFKDKPISGSAAPVKKRTDKAS
jgi:hypothetical protein